MGFQVKRILRQFWVSPGKYKSFLLTFKYVQTFTPILMQKWTDCLKPAFIPPEPELFIPLLGFGHIAKGGLWSEITPHLPSAFV